MKRLKKIKFRRIAQSILGLIIILLEYVLYTHDRLVMSWTAKTMVNLKLWHEITDFKKHALGRAFVIWFIIGLCWLIFY